RNTALRLHIILRLTDSQNDLITRSLTCLHVTSTNRTMIGIACCRLLRTHITFRVKRRTDFLRIALFTVATPLPRLIEFSRFCLLRILQYLRLFTFRLRNRPASWHILYFFDVKNTNGLTTTLPTVMFLSRSAIRSGYTFRRVKLG